MENITAGQGWIALAVVISGRWKPFYVLLRGLTFGFVDAFQLGLQAIGTAVPSQFALMLPYLIPITILAGMYKKTAVPATLAIPYKRGER
ncbi:MAG: hypothetical protein ACJ71F_17615 [Nitrososphaeraceae archaeon]